VHAGIANCLDPGSGRWLALLLLVATGAATGAEQEIDQASPLERDVYARAERFLSWNAEKYTRNLDVDYHWIGTTDRFWYSRQTQAGKEFVIVDAASGKVHPAFDHILLARGLSDALGREVDPQKLPFKSFELLDADRVIQVSVDKKDWRCGLMQGRCRAAEPPSIEAGGLISPDGKWSAYLKGYDIWIRSLADRTERPLSRDGEVHDDYGRFAGTGGAVGMRRETQTVPVVLWSPDSSKLVTHRLDERKVLDLDLLETAPHGGVRPVLHRYRYAFPGDANKPAAQLVIFDIASGRRIDVNHDPLPVTFIGPIEDNRVWWSADGKTVYIIPREEGERRVQLLAVNADTGATRTLIEESGKTYVEIGGSAFDRAVRSLADGRIIWYSERDDWGHLYLYDKNGKLIRRLTAGPWKVMDVVRIDERQGRVFFTAVGREAGEDPYQDHLYVVSLDGSGLRLLTPEDADHEIRTAAPEIRRDLLPVMPGPAQASVSPSGRYVVETYSRPDLPSATVLRTTAGRLIATLERADISALQAGGLTLPEPYSVNSADGHTKLYGTMYRPSSFDPDKKYPIIDVIYPGPQMIVTPKDFKGALFADFDNTQTLAELGFIVIEIDGRGTPFRSKSFHDVSYGDLAQAGNLEDHIAGIRQLAARYPYIDKDRVGITGWSGGGFASTRAILAYPDFYKVAVSIAGEHDSRGYLLAWGPTYQGPYQGANYDAEINARLAGNLKGKLLLLHGEMDDNVPAALTLQVVDELVKADKDFDFLLLPGQDHTLAGVLGYVERKRWDYFVRNLLGRLPPADYRIAVPQD
jgi:dipeptidyl-peptidase-4